MLGCGVRAACLLVAWLAVLQSPGYHCNFVDAANDRVLADVGLLVHDRACHTRASADMAVMEEDGRCRPMVKIGHAGSSSVSGGSSASSSMCAYQ